jgi:hypothetical protein
MIIWKERANFKADFNLHNGDAGACSEMGLQIKLCRAAEYIIKCSNLRLTPQLEWVGRVYVATDWSNRGYTAELTPMKRRPSWVMFRVCYESTGKRRMPDDLYCAECELMHATSTNIYSSDRTEYAARLIALVAQCWKESWELFHQATFGDKYRLKWWPVRIWAHREPVTAFDLLEDGQLVKVAGGLSIGEAALVDY